MNTADGRTAGAKQDGAWRVVGAFPVASAARRAESALAAQFDAASVVVAGAPPASAGPPPEREERFLGRLIPIIVAWSTVGAAVGVAMGIALNVLDVGPGGTAGIGIQIASWAIFAHLVAGMWAGYALLTKGESREPVTRTSDGRAVVSVQCPTGEARDRAASLLRAAGATAVAIYNPDGRPVE